MDYLACVCTAIATAITIFVSEAIWLRHKSKTKGDGEKITEVTFASEKGVQVPETDGLDSSTEEQLVTLYSTDTGQCDCQTEAENPTLRNAKMGEKQTFAKMKVVTHFTDPTGRQCITDKGEKGYILDTDDTDPNDVFFNFEKSEMISGEDGENNVDVVADNNKNHETEIRHIPSQRTRRMSDVIDSIGDSHNMEKIRHYSRNSSGSSPPATPPSDAGYSSVSSTPSRSKIVQVIHVKNRDTIDAGRECKANYECEETGGVQGETEAAPDENETTDAGRIKPPIENLSDMIVGGPIITAAMPVSANADEYNMNHPRRGRAVIFNNDTFDNPAVANRSGSEADVKNLERLFAALEFQTTVHHNKEYSEIRSIVDSLSKEDHSDADCLVVTVLSHGLKQGYILSKDVPYSVDYLWKPFTADKCITLAGKPKIFIVQACRGEEVDPGVRLVSSRTQTDTTEGPYKIPTHADFLIAYSSAEGFYSWRNPESGTWFIQCLCKELEEQAGKMDFLKILTRTARRVALEYESFNDIIEWQNAKKQVPSITSMLIRDIYFRKKK